jgi:hypothetical protein
MRNELTPPELQLSDVEVRLVWRLRVPERASSTLADSYLRSGRLRALYACSNGFGVQCWLKQSHLAHEVDLGDL